MDKDDVGFERLYRDYYPGVVGFFARKGFAVEEARDLAQEVFLRVYRGMDRLRDPAFERTWIFRIAHNLRLNEFRYWSSRGGLGRKLSLDDTDALSRRTGSDAIVSPEPPVDQLIDEEEKRRLLWEAIADLPAQQRRCVRLRLIHEFKYREIARTMKVSLDTVKSCLHDAKENLKRRFGETLPDFEDPDEGKATP